MILKTGLKLKVLIKTKELLLLVEDHGGLYGRLMNHIRIHSEKIVFMLLIFFSSIDVVLK